MRTTLGDAAERLRRQEPRGEFVLVVEGRAAVGEPPGDDQVLAALRRCLDDGLSKRDAVAEVARRTGEPRRRIYELSIAL